MRNAGTIERTVLHGWNRLEILCAKDVTHNISRHMHRVFCIGLVEQGVRECFTHGRWHRIEAGQIFVVNPNEVHACRSADDLPYTYKTICFSELPAILGIMPAEKEVSWRLASPIINDIDLVRKYQTFVQASRELSLEDNLVGSGRDLFQHILHYTMPKPRLASDEPYVIERVKEYLESHYSRNVSLEELANLTNYSPFHLNHIFLQAQEMPPHAYQNLIRIRRAKLALENETSLVELAAAMGFSDQSHFTKVFKAMTGMTPGQFARTNRPPGK